MERGTRLFAEELEIDRASWRSRRGCRGGADWAMLPCSFLAFVGWPRQGKSCTCSKVLTLALALTLDPDILFLPSHPRRLLFAPSLQHLNAAFDSIRPSSALYRARPAATLSTFVARCFLAPAEASPRCLIQTPHR